MTTADQHRFPLCVTPWEHEVATRARALGVDWVTVPISHDGRYLYDGVFCGTCGRMVHHPNCPRFITRSTRREQRGATQ